mgnify:CR=1 FL=1
MDITPDLIAAGLGRFHPVILHAPIGLLLGLGACEAWALVRREPLQRGVRVLLAGLFLASGAAAAGTGWLLAGDASRYGPSDTLSLHRWLGVGLAVLSAVVCLSAVRGWGRAYGAGLLAALALVGPAGHLGGEMTHGAGYLTEPWRGAGAAEPPVFVGSADGLIAFETHVAPFLQAYCVSCHGRDKQRGGLALHTPEAIAAGGDYGPVLFAGDPDNSELVVRMRAPLDDELRMPPESRRQPSREEVEMIAAWIAAGAEMPGTP